MMENGEVFYNLILKVLVQNIWEGTTKGMDLRKEELWEWFWRLATTNGHFIQKQANMH